MVEDFKIKQLNKIDTDHFQQLILLFEKVFENENAKNPSKSYLKSLLANDSFIAYVAIKNNEVIGGLTAYELAMYYNKGSEMFIYDIAVAPKFQRKGIGKKLLMALSAYCKKNNISDIFVAANKEDKHALKFYRSAGGKAEKVVHFNFRVK